MKKTLTSISCWFDLVEHYMLTLSIFKFVCQMFIAECDN